MRCSSCGAEIPDGVKFCPSCGATQPAAAPPVYAQPPQPQYAYQAPTAPPPPPLQQPLPKATGQIVFSIINMLCCGGLFGLIALIFSIMASSAKSYEEAVKKLKTAKTLNIVGIIIGVVLWIVVIAIYGVAILAMIQSGEYNFDYSGY